MYECRHVLAHPRMAESIKLSLHFDPDRGYSYTERDKLGLEVAHDGFQLFMLAALVHSTTLRSIPSRRSPPTRVTCLILPAAGTCSRAELLSPLTQRVPPASTRGVVERPVGTTAAWLPRFAMRVPLALGEPRSLRPHCKRTAVPRRSYDRHPYVRHH